MHFERELQLKMLTAATLYKCR